MKNVTKLELEVSSKKQKKLEWPWGKAKWHSSHLCSYLKYKPRLPSLVVSSFYGPLMLKNWSSELELISAQNQQNLNLSWNRCLEILDAGWSSKGIFVLENLSFLNLIFSKTIKDHCGHNQKLMLIPWLQLNSREQKIKISHIRLFSPCINSMSSIN